MDWIITLIVVVGGYYIIEMALAHREKMAKIKKDDK